MSASRNEVLPHDRHEEFVSLLTASHHKLLGYTLSLLGRWHDAQDVLQRTSLLMWQKFAEYESGTDFIAWASTFCFYEAKAHLRLISRSPLHFDDDLLDLLSAERQEDLRQLEGRMAALESCLRKLREADRRLIDASCDPHGGISALAAKLGRAPATLYNKLSHLRRILADCVTSSTLEEAT
jgi:RNA polymerase sigma-70 factor, ECF subfamily